MTPTKTKNRISGIQVVAWVAPALLAIIAAIAILLACLTAPHRYPSPDPLPRLAWEDGQLLNFPTAKQGERK